MKSEIQSGTIIRVVKGPTHPDEIAKRIGFLERYTRILSKQIEENEQKSHDNSLDINMLFWLVRGLAVFVAGLVFGWLVMQ